MLILSVGLLFYVWFLGSLSTALRSASGSPRLPTVAFGGGMLGASFFLIGLTVFAATAYRPEETSPELTRALNDIGLVLGGPASAGFAALFAATALVILRSGALPSWLGWLNVAGAIASLCALGVIFTDHGAFGPDGVIGLVLPIAGFSVPIAALSIVLYRELGKPSGITGAVSDAVGRRHRSIGQ